MMYVYRNSPLMHLFKLTVAGMDPHDSACGWCTILLPVLLLKKTRLSEESLSYMVMCERQLQSSETDHVERNS